MRSLPRLQGSASINPQKIEQVLRHHKKQSSKQAKTSMKVISSSVLALLFALLILVPAAQAKPYIRENQAFSAFSPQAQDNITIGNRGFSKLEDAIEAAQDGDTLDIRGGGRLLLTKNMLIDKRITINFIAKVAFRRDVFNTEALFHLTRQAVLTIKMNEHIISFNANTHDSTSIFQIDEGAQLLIEGQLNLYGKRGLGVRGGFFDNAGTLKVTGASFRDAQAQSGAVLYNRASGTAEFKESEIANTYSSLSGSAFYNEGTLTIKNTRVSGARANDRGAVLYAAPSSNTTIEAGDIGSSNSDRAGGYAITLANNTAHLSMSRVVMGNSRIHLMGGSKLFVASAEPYDTSHPLSVDSEIKNPARLVIETPDQDVARQLMNYVQSSDLILVQDKSQPAHLVIDDSGLADVFADIDNPYKDDLGYELKESLDTASKREELRQKIIKIYGSDQAVGAQLHLARLEALDKGQKYFQEHEDLVRSTELDLSRLGDPSADPGRTHQWFQFDNRDLTGLFIDPKVPKLPTVAVPGKTLNDRFISLDVFVSSETNLPIALSARQVGVADESQPADNLPYRNFWLKKGYNRVRIDISNKRNPFALYLRNNSTKPARVRIAASDFWASKTQQKAPDYQPASAAEGITGTQLATYPAYIAKRNDTKNFLAFIADLKRRTKIFTQESHSASDTVKTVADMADIRQGIEDISTTLFAMQNAFSQVNDSNAQEVLNRGLSRVSRRFRILDRFEGYDLEQSSGTNQPIPFRRVILADKTTTIPSSLFATSWYYHLGPGDASPIAAGDLASIFAWGNNHEYGHQLDNTTYAVPETTNNVYSIRAGLEKFLYQTERNPHLEARISDAYTHPQIVFQQSEVDKYLNRSIQDETNARSGGWADGVIFRRTLTIFSAFEYFKHFDYIKAGYDFEQSPFTKELAQDVNKYGAFGNALRIERRERSKFFALKNGDDENSRFSRLVALSSAATGFDMVDYWEARGFKNIAPKVKEFSRRYPKLPVKLWYYHLDQELKAIQNDIYHNHPLFDEASVAQITSITRDTANNKERATITAAVPSYEDATALFEIYKDGKLIGFTRGTSFVDENAAGALDSAYTVRAYDYRLNPSHDLARTPSKSHLVVFESQTGLPLAREQVEQAGFPRRVPELKENYHWVIKNQDSTSPVATGIDDFGDSERAHKLPASDPKTTPVTRGLSYVMMPTEVHKIPSTLIENTAKKRKPWTDIENTAKKRKPWTDIVDNATKRKPWTKIENTAKKRKSWLELVPAITATKNPQDLPQNDPHKNSSETAKQNKEALKEKMSSAAGSTIEKLDSSSENLQKLPSTAELNTNARIQKASVVFAALFFFGAIAIKIIYAGRANKNPV